MNLLQQARVPHPAKSTRDAGSDDKRIQAGIQGVLLIPGEKQHIWRGAPRPEPELLVTDEGVVLKVAADASTITFEGFSKYRQKKDGSVVGRVRSGPLFVDLHHASLLPYRGPSVLLDACPRHLQEGSCHLTGAVTQQKWADVVRPVDPLDVHRSQKALHFLPLYLDLCQGLVAFLCQFYICANLVG